MINNYFYLAPKNSHILKHVCPRAGHHKLSNVRKTRLAKRQEGQRKAHPLTLSILKTCDFKLRRSPRTNSNQLVTSLIANSLQPPNNFFIYFLARIPFFVFGNIFSQFLGPFYFVHGPVAPSLSLKPIV